jgi:dinuclear metal center YbgI/SA1388 family protein
MLRNAFIQQLDQLLQVNNFHDYCPNGLQIEGQQQIKKIVTGVSLNLELIEQAIALGADTIIVHHGVFWHKTSYALTGIKYQRVAKLIKHDINLIAYHLPLDNHPNLGNNAQLAKLLDFTIDGQTGEQNLIWYGKLNKPLRLSELAKFYYQQTNHVAQFYGQDRLIERVAWCTGGADSFFSAAIDLGVDCFISGEVQEPILHLAKESGVGYLAGGHYVSERYGIIALTDYLLKQGHDAQFIELYNPI